MKVLSIEQMANLKQLGVDTSKASLHYVYLPTARSIFNETEELESEPTLFACKTDMLEGYPTFALQDVIELLPTTIHTDGGLFYLTIMRTCIFYYFIYEDDKRILNKEFDDCIMQSAYEMLVWVAENGHLTSK